MASLINKERLITLIPQRVVYALWTLSHSEVDDIVCSVILYNMVLSNLFKVKLRGTHTFDLILMPFRIH